MVTLTRRKGDLVRNVNDKHGIIVMSDTHTNTARVWLADAQAEETFSWWDLKQPNDDTARAFGVSHLAGWAPHKALVVVRQIERQRGIPEDPRALLP